MLGRPDVLLTPPRSNSLLLLPRSFSGFQPTPTLLHFLYTPFLYKNQAHPLSPQPLPHSYTKTPGCHPERAPPPAIRHSFTLSIEGLLSSLDATLTATESATPLDATLTRNRGRGHDLNLRREGWRIRYNRGSRFGARLGAQFGTWFRARFRKRGEIEHSGDGWGWVDGYAGCWS